MALPISVSVRVTGRLHEAENILIRAVSETFDELGRILQNSVRERVRVFRGNEKRGVRRETSGKGLNKFLAIYGELIQHKIDEYGLEPGTFPPWAPGTLIYEWVSNNRAIREPTPRLRRASHVRTRNPNARIASKRRRKRGAAKGRGRLKKGPATKRTRAAAKARARETALRRFAFAVARSIFESGISPGRPFSNTLRDKEVTIMNHLRACFRNAVNRINA